MVAATETAAPRRRFVGRKNLNSDSSQPITINETSDVSLILKNSTQFFYALSLNVNFDIFSY
jgi:hypothetical protein